MRIGIAVGLTLAACTANGPATGADLQAVAAVDTVSGVTIAFTTGDAVARLPQVVSGTAATDFRWLRLRIPAGNPVLSSLSSGALVDFRVLSQVEFSQVYVDACNPRNNDYSNCWFREDITPGGEGVSGTVNIKIGDAEVRASFDLMLEGQTDRYGLPSVYFKHGTTAEYSAPIIKPGVGGREEQGQ